MSFWTEIICTGTGSYKVAISTGDTTPDYLVNKLVAGTGITITKNNAGGDETLTLASSGGSSVTIYNDTVSGTINGSNTSFTVSNSITYPISLTLGNSSYQAGVDYTVSGTSISMTSAPDASLAGQPFWLSHT